VQQLKLSNKFLEPYIKLLKESPKERKTKKIQTICQTEVCSIGIMLWKPGEWSKKEEGKPGHQHGNILDVIRVHQGILSNTIFANENGEIETESKYHENDEVFIDRHKRHHMGNNDSDQDLITIHFRFGEIKKSPDENIPSIDETQPIISGDSILTQERALEFSATPQKSLSLIN
jgi:hypothetical protein